MPPAEAPLLRATGLRRSFGSLTVLRGIDLALERGEVLTVVGPNGAGKSTLLRLLAGLMRPTAGQVHVAGRRLTASDPEARRPIGLLSHQSFLYDDLTLRENLLFSARLYGIGDPAQAVQRAIDDVDLAAKADQPVRALSRGMLQRAAIARALLHQPALVLLDEPFTGLDAVSADRLRGFLARLRLEGRGAVVVTHHPAETWELSSRAAVMVRGAWAMDEPCGGDLDGFLDRYREAVGG